MFTKLSDLLLDKPHLLMEFYTLPEMAVGDEKEISQEEWDKAMKLVNDHNNSGNIDPEIKGFYYIDVTGRWEVYFTFWRFKEIPPDIERLGVIKNPVYMQNLTTNFLTSVQKALSKMPKSVKLYIMTAENREGLIGKTRVTKQEDIRFTFGKYRGKTIGEVYLDDPGYIAWLAKNADPKYENTKINQALRVFADMYYEEVTKQNREKFKDVQFVGQEGSPWEGEVEVYKIDKKTGQKFGSRWSRSQPSTYTISKAVDAAGNKFLITNLDKAFPKHEIVKGVKVKIKGRITGNIEILGVKFNKLAYVKGIDPGNAVPKRDPHVKPEEPQTPEIPMNPEPPEATVMEPRPEEDQPDF